MGTVNAAVNIAASLSLLADGVGLLGVSYKQSHWGVGVLGLFCFCLALL